ncbi:hypothetical protein EYF80_048419 [Liparis tanakae]|uniref:Uncharacterized protein n=1 Tax=Liparis tanakae TaxID=230148 RepID=A0A4Z2FJM0_9TELE|nr:hypothetical protein EYF80_048419 [Liparis tanakae]
MPVTFSLSLIASISSSALDWTEQRELGLKERRWETEKRHDVKGLKEKVNSTTSYFLNDPWKKKETGRWRRLQQTGEDSLSLEKHLDLGSHQLFDCGGVGEERGLLTRIITADQRIANVQEKACTSVYMSTREKPSAEWIFGSSDPGTCSVIRLHRDWPGHQSCAPSRDCMGIGIYRVKEQ